MRPVRQPATRYRESWPKLARQNQVIDAMATPNGLVRLRRVRRAPFLGRYALPSRAVPYHGMKRFVTFVAVAVGVAAGRSAGAAEGVAEDVVVRGSQAGGFSSTARIEDAPREVTDAASLIEPLPGVHVRRFGADDGFSTLSIRGSSSSEVSVVLAGVPLTGGADPTLDLATLPLWPGARARVYRSFAPAALGPGSLGGTLVLDPPTARGPSRTDAWIAAGAFGARRLRVGDVRALETAAGTMRVASALSASRSDDDYSYVDPVASSPGHDVSTTRQNAEHAAINGLLSVTMPARLGPGEPARVTITTLAQARRQHLPGSAKFPTLFQRLDSNRELCVLELAQPGAQGTWSGRLWARREDLRLKDDPRAGTETLGPTHTNDAIVASGTSVGWRGRPRTDLTLEARADGSVERFAPGAYEGAASPPPGATRATAGAAADVEWRAMHAWTWSASARGDLWSDAAGDAGARAEAHPTGHLGTEVREGPFTLSAHAGALGRPPSFIERYGNRGAFIGDAGLRSESAWTADVGARAEGGMGPVRVRAELAAFGTWADDLIVFVYQGASGRAKATNIGRARLLGLEAELGLRAYGFDLRASYTGLATANETTCTAQSGPLGARPACERPPLPGRPQHDVVTDLSYTLGPARVRYGVDAVTGIYPDDTGSIPVPARVLHSAGLRLEVPHAPGVRVALDVRNLFDLRVATYPGVLGPSREPIGDAYDYPLPGRTALLSVRVALERE